MISKIQILDSQAANQIAAGEVVERPVSVVKELIENALDAGASQIEVIVEGSGVERIRVQDNGQGITAEDMPLAVLRHATSKIRKIEDLNTLHTLGFRGEALPSIASVAKLEIMSRPPSEISGKVLRMAGGEKLEFADIGCPPGTIITVEDLFYNTPARRKFLKSQNTEFGQISDCIGRLALARPDVAFTLKHPKVVVLQTPGRGNLLESIGAVLGQATARRLLPVNDSLGEWRLEGYISPPDLVRSTKQGETLIVNQRIIRSNNLSRAILEGYHTLIPAKLYPIAVLHIHVPPHEYDVNVHPTKMEIRFHKEKELTEFIAQAIRKALLSAHPIAPFGKNPLTKTDFGAKALSLKETESPASRTNELKPNTGKPSQYAFLFPVQSPQASIPEQKASYDELFPKKTHDSEESSKNAQEYLKELPEEPFTGISKAPGAKSMSTDLFKEEPQEHYEKQSEEFFFFDGEKGGKNFEDLAMVKEVAEANRPNFPEEIQTVPGDLNSKVISSEEPYVLPEDLKARNPLLALRPLGQIFNTYILATDEEQLVIIDQHAAHERINYERLLAEQQKNPGNCQMLLIPQLLEFTPAEEEALLEYILLLNDMGFILEHFGTRAYLLRGIPAYSGSYQGETLLREFLGQVLAHQIPPTLDKLLEEWIYLLACKESIKAKENLNLLEMEQLILQLSKTQNPYTCPHGRPTMIQLTKEELEHRFYRS